MSGINAFDGGHFFDSAGRRRSKRIVVLAAMNHRCQHNVVAFRPQPQPTEPQPNDHSPGPAEGLNASSGMIARPHRGPRFVRSKPFECSACLKRFARTGELAKHALEEHKPQRRRRDDHGTPPGRKPYQCSLCPASFDRHWMLASHADRFHPLGRMCVNAMCAATSDTPVVWPNVLPSTSVPVVPWPPAPVVPSPDRRRDV